MRHDAERLQDVLDAIEAIERYTSSGRARFDADELVRVFCLHHIEVIGEAVSRLSQELRDRHPVAPWRNIVAMRNALVHGYFDVDWEAVWNVVERDLKPLRSAVEQIMRAEGWMP
jgi:uncharacterized protein with HEPN domain